jgi:hypothetical protein
MINADVQQHNETLIYVRFSDPNEDFGSKPYFTVDSMAEVKRRLYVRNRAYILDTLTSWLNQRLHALPASQKQITTCLAWMDEMRKCSFFHVCEFILVRRPIFESIAPNQSSKFYDHYLTAIVPILDFCSQDHE